MVEQAAQFWRRGLGLSCMILNVNYYIQKLYIEGSPSNPNVMLGVPKPSFAESVFDLDRPAGRPGRRTPFRPEQITALLMTHLTSKFCPTEIRVLNWCMGTGSTAKDYFVSAQAGQFFRMRSE